MKVIDWDKIEIWGNNVKTKKEKYKKEKHLYRIELFHHDYNGELISHSVICTTYKKYTKEKLEKEYVSIFWDIYEDEFWPHKGDFIAQVYNEEKSALIEEVCRIEYIDKSDYEKIKSHKD